MIKRGVFFFISCFCLFLGANPLVVSGTEAPVLYLSLQDDLGRQFIKRVNKERRQIKIATHRLSDPMIIRALIEAHRRSVLVEVLVDPVTVTKNSPLKRLVEEGISVFVWQAEGLPLKKGVKVRRLQHAFCVFGEDVSWTGSYSFSLKRKCQPIENAVLLYDEAIAKGFLQEFERLRQKHSLPFNTYVERKR